MDTFRPQQWNVSKRIKSAEINLFFEDIVFYVIFLAYALAVHSVPL